LIVGLADDSGVELALFGLDGSPDGMIPLPPGQIPSAFYNAATHHAIRACPGGCYFMHNDAFVALPAFYRFDFATRKLQKTPAPVADLGPLVVTVIDTCMSEDGTPIPIRLVHRPALDLSRPRPVLLHGYGNLNVFFYEAPAWYMPFIDAGGVYAWVTLRGGGESGKESWYQGRGKMKGQCSLDFCAAAEHLAEIGIAARDQIACMGFSCGSVLMGTVLARLGRQARPDLFRAVAGIGGFYDLFTYLKVVRIFADEFGNPEDPEQAAVIATFSPYQNITDGIPYPATLIACTDGDVGWPGHARKLIARAHEATSSRAPILYRKFDTRYHGETGAISGENGPESGEIAPEITAFIMRELGMTPNAGAGR
jgi:prolyl oligopeptidase